MNRLADFMARDQPETLCVPDVSGLTAAKAAVEYAKSGFVIVPIRQGTKHAGSLLGEGWDGKASRSPDMARLWWREYPNAGIAVVTGHSGLVVFDLDTDEIPGELSFLKTAAIHLTRPGGSQRGHYVFKTRETFDNTRISIDGQTVADVRSGTSIFVVEPTQHAKPEGHYHWDTSYPIPWLPEEAREYLRVSQARAGGDATSEEVANFEARYSSGPQPMVIDSVIETTFGANPDVTRDALRDALCWAARESKGKRYGWREALDKIRTAAVQSYAKRGRKLSDTELSKLIAYAIGEVRDIPQEELWLRWQTDETKQAVADFKGSQFDHSTRREQSNMSGVQPEWMDDDSAGLDPTQPSEDEIAAEIRRLNKRAEAERRRKRECFVEPTDQGDAIHQFLNREESQKYLIDQLIPYKGHLMLNAQWKIGKTTLLLNLLRTLVTGEPFLNRFALCGDPIESVAYWNLEVDRNTFNDWLSELDLTDPKQKYGHRIHPFSTRDEPAKPDFNNPLWVEWTTKWLRERAVEVWFIDTFSKLFGDNQNDNSEVGAWWRILESIAAGAGVKSIAIAHHTGNSEESQGRGRGASALMDNPDSLWSFRHPGKAGTLPTTPVRYLAAKGRGVELFDTELTFDPATKLYTVTGSKRTRTTAIVDAKARELAQYLTVCHGPVNKGKLCKGLSLAQSGSQLAETNSVFAYAIERQWITETKGVGNAKLYQPGKNVKETQDGPK